MKQLLCDEANHGIWGMELLQQPRYRDDRRRGCLRFGDNMLGEMKAYAHLKPGQDGSKRLVEQYGDRLLCVRYRFDETRGMKIKTVELIVDERPLTAPRFKDDDLVPVHVGYDEKELRQQLRTVKPSISARQDLTV